MHRDPDALVAAYQARLPHAGAGRLRAAILGDALFGVGSCALTEAHGNAHCYQFAWRSTALDGQLGAAHAVELPFVFDRLDLPQLRGESGLLGPKDPPEWLAQEMHAAWVSFARTGNPGWPPFNDNRQLRRFGSGITALGSSGDGGRRGCLT